MGEGKWENMKRDEFEARLSTVRGAMLRLASLKISARQDAEDVVQEACLRAYRSMDALSDPDRFKAWIIQITRNQIRDFYRARYRREALSEQIRPGNFAHPPRRTDVSDALDALSPRDRTLLSRFYLHDQSVADIAQTLAVPEGTVKSRLHTARGRFREVYRGSEKGEVFMKKLPEMMPDYTIRMLDTAPFPVRVEAVVGWFIVPKVGEKCNWAMYDFPEKKMTSYVETAVMGRASVHGIEGVEVVSKEHVGGKLVERTFIVQLTDTHSRILAETHMDGDVKRTITFLDGDNFTNNWGFGPDNCGIEINFTPKGAITREGNDVKSVRARDVIDVVGRAEVVLAGKRYDTVCLMECLEDGVATEQFVDKDGRPILWRRFNSDGWKAERYGGLWSKRMPDNERITINGETYVHWYDCLTDDTL